MDDADIAAAADELDLARRTGARMAALAGACAPSSAADAYRIQYETARRRGGVGAWKIAPGRTDGAAIPAGVVLPAPATFASPLPMAVEVEIAFRIGHDLPPRDAPYERDEVSAAIASVHPAIEIQGSRYFEPKAVDPVMLLADGQSCLAAVWGEGTADWRDIAFETVPIRLAIDGRPAAERTRGLPASPAIEALSWLVQHAAATCGGLTAGTIVITGARAGPVSVLAGSRIEAEIGGIGAVSVTLSAPA